MALHIPTPGWVQRIPTPAWPSDLAAHMSPSAVTNQGVAGALATWALMHSGDPRWSRLPPIFGNAIDLFGADHAQGFQVSGQPAPGEMAVYRSSYAVFGHIAAAAAVEPRRYEVIEQTLLDLNPTSNRAGRPSTCGRWRGRMRRWLGSWWGHRSTAGGLKLLWTSR